MTHPPAAATAPVAAAPVYRAERLPHIDAFLDRAQRLAHPASLPFHGPHWLRAWYGTLGRTAGREPLLVAVHDLSRAQDVMLLPLVLQRRHGSRFVELADAGVVDYASPLLAPDWAGGAPEAHAARALWKALRPVLACGDVWLIDKMLPTLMAEAAAVAEAAEMSAPAEATTDGTARPAAPASNPLALALPLRASELFGNQFEVAGEWEGWRRSLDKRVRKEIERCWRVFQRSPDARFEHVTDLERARALLTTIERQQSDRLLERLGAAYRLDEEAYRQFYRQLLDGGLADGSVVMTALYDGDEVVSGLLGVANGRRYIALRQSLGDARWKACSPGRLLDEGTARHMHEQGWRWFDFGVGSYFHKTTLDMQPIALLQGCVPLTWRGHPWAWAWQAKLALKSMAKRHPALGRLVQRLRGQAVPVQSAAAAAAAGTGDETSPASAPSTAPAAPTAPTATPTPEAAAPAARPKPAKQRRPASSANGLAGTPATTPTSASASTPSSAPSSSPTGAPASPSANAAPSSSPSSAPPAAPTPAAEPTAAPAPTQQDTL